MKKNYIPQKIEPHVQNIWEINNSFKVTEDNTKEKFYCLAMIPYPSGKLHMGHVRNYTISDVISRYQRMLGKNVLQPIGWDAFGLPAEIAAIQNNTKPSKWTYDNIQYMKKQLKQLGFSYDWSREITTCKPEYYQWEQWLFIKLYKKKLIYKKKSWVHWCENDKTVLANEQVINGLCWRCNNKTITKKISQWFIKITKYAKELLTDLNTLKEWPKNVKTMQKNWIGKKEGIELKLKINHSQDNISIFTYQPKALIEATYIAISPFHKLATKLSKNNKDIKKFISICSKTHNSMDTNVAYIGINTYLTVSHPISHQQLPIWIGNFIQIDFATGAILCIPTHNRNELQFALKNHIKIKPTILNNNNKTFLTETHNTKNNQSSLLNYKLNNNLKNEQNYSLIINKLKQKKIGKHKTYYFLKDWNISRQRYWGVPIPMATLEDNSIIPIPKKYLPIILDENIEFTKLQQTIDPYSNQKKIKIKNKLATLESDTLDTFFESSWYYARFTCTQFKSGMIDKNSANYWLPIDQYIGGIEHAIMHLMYFRFFHKLLRDLKLLNSDEPVKRLLCQGMVLSDAFYYLDKNDQKKWLSITSSDVAYDSNHNVKKSFMYKNKKVYHEGMIKMSKSKNNGIEPEKMIQKYGADTIRLFIMFAAPIESSLEWKETGVIGIQRFLKKIWMLSYNYIKKHKNSNKIINQNTLTPQQKKFRSFLHTTIKKVSYDINNKQSFNTAIAAIMKLVNKLTTINLDILENSPIVYESLSSIILMLYPFIPHFSFTLWKKLTNNTSNIDFMHWPITDNEAIIKDIFKIIVQINGKKRDIFSISKKWSKKEILDFVLHIPKIKKYLENKIISRVIFIPNKVINLLIN